MYKIVQLLDKDYDLETGHGSFEIHIHDDDRLGKFDFVLYKHYSDNSIDSEDLTLYGVTKAELKEIAARLTSLAEEK
jgi:hypothetical protein